MKSITIFTPTYNRAYCLDGCYKSLLRQTNKDFIWMIIDDGSTDNTKELVDSWQKQKNGFEIVYIYKENGGMHTAYNTAYANMTTELSMNVDSDDWLTDNAVEKVLSFWQANRRHDVGGIYALDSFENGEIIGEKFPNDLKEFKGWGYKTIFYFDGDGRKKHVNIHGDKKFIGVNSIINKYPPIPVFEGEKYYSLYYKQHYIERDYSILILNEPVCIVEYRTDSNSNMMFKQYTKNPNGFCEERRFVMKNAPTFKLRLIAAIHYVAESLFAKDRMFIKHSTNKPCTILSLIPGIGLYLLIRRKSRD